jgi:hypothetical protein
MIDAEIERVAHPDATVAARRRVRMGLSRLTEGTAATWSSPPEEFINEVMSVISPHDLEASAAKSKAASLYMGIRFRLFAAVRMDVLRQNRRDVERFWEWTRRYAQDRLGEGESAVQMQSGLLERDWSDEDLARLRLATRSTCSSVLSILGTGLHILAGGEWTALLEPPPQITGLSLPPTGRTEESTCSRPFRHKASGGRPSRDRIAV